MIEGISVALTTFNHLKYLQQCLHSISKYSVLPKTEASIFVDGSNDGTFEWLEKQGIPHKGREKNVGAFSGWNNAVKNCHNEYFIQAEDDLFFGPEWDLKLAAWIEELGENYIVMPQLVEPTFGSYPPLFDCGRTIETFEEEKFTAYVRQHLSRHEAISDPCGFWTMKRGLFFSIGGFDENYDPITTGSIDFMLSLSEAHPQLRWVRVWDSMVYHFPPQFHRPFEWESPEPRVPKPFAAEIAKRNVTYFEKKHGITIEQAYNSIPVGIV